MKKIEIIDEKTIKIDGDTFRRDDVSTFFDTPESTKLEFKVGDWIIGVSSYTPDIPARILNINWNFADVDIPNGDNYQWKNDHSVFWRLATEEEIESHLKKVAEEKGYKQGVIIRCVTYPERNEFVLTGDFEYKDYSDRLVDENAKNKDDEYPSIYDNGKWATIVPQKKPLPKNKEEFYDFLGSVFQLFPQDRDTATEFLNQYED